MSAPIRFDRIELRTPDPAAARRFYAELLAEPVADIVDLPAEAAARGAPPHWLGHLGVADVEASARALVLRGATRLGPTRPARDGGESALLREPGGAVIALATASAIPVRDDLVWHLLNTADLAASVTAFTALGWHFLPPRDHGPPGLHHPFAWQPAAGAVGAFLSTAGRPGVHPHWLFHLRIADLDRGLALVRAAGGLALAPQRLPDGARIAVCDDPQGAAFALYQPA